MLHYARSFNTKLVLKIEHCSFMVLYIFDHLFFLLSLVFGVSGIEIATQKLHLMK